MKKNFALILISTIAVSCNLFQKITQRKTYDFAADTMGRFDSLYYPTFQDTVKYEADYFEIKKSPICATQISFADFKGSTTKYWDLLLTRLSVTPNFQNRELQGIAELRLSPHFHSTDSLILNAVNMQIDSVWQFWESKKNNIPLKFIHENQKLLKIYFTKKITRNEFVQIRIKYTAKPYSVESAGNTAITDNKGVYFINHDLSNTDKPRQLWTQSETHSASHWFPTLDAPNQKTKWEIEITVADSLITLSNGKLIKTIKKDSATKTDIWKQDLPQSPYLCMMAVGNWSIIESKWKDKKLEYLVEPEFAPHALLNFGNTPEMIDFFSRYTGFDFPWDKYSQVVVRDFVSGAMENTGAVVHMEQLQQTPRQHIDQNYESYVSHELFHHWFGDLVTCESWAHLTLNESWATYGQYLWNEYKYGKNFADQEFQSDKEAAFFTFFSGDKTLTRHNYQSEDAGDMFDNISYQKGAWVLHMLRNYLGEDVFREGIKQYLNTYKFKTAETDDLRKTFEEVSGMDLNWFFNQWYYNSGHPQIELRDSTDRKNGWQYLHIKQIQNSDYTYSFPIEIKTVKNKIEKKQLYFIHTSDTTILINTEKSDYWIFDNQNTLLAELEYSQNYSKSEREFLLKSTQQLFDLEENNANRYAAFKMVKELLDFQNLEDSIDNSGLRKMAIKGVNIPYSPLQFACLQVLNKDEFPKDSVQIISALKNCALNKNFNSTVRAAAFRKVNYFKFDKTLVNNLINDQSLILSEAAFANLQDSSKQLQLVLNEMKNPKNENVVNFALLYLRLHNASKYNLQIMENATLNSKITSAQFKRLIQNFLPYSAESGPVSPENTGLKKLRATTNNSKFKSAYDDFMKDLESTHDD